MAQRVQPIRVGADVDSRFIELACHDTAERACIDNNAAAIRAWLAAQPGPIELAVEATGRYHQQLVELAHEAGVTVFVLNPQWLHHYRRSVGQRAKTDRCDARLLARYLAHERSALRPWTPPPAGQREAWSLLKRRAKLVQARHMLEQSFRDVPGVRREFRAMRQRLHRLEQALERRLQACIVRLGWGPAWRRCQTLHGLGPLSAAALVIAFHRGPFRSADAFVAFLGLDVRVRQSGRFVGQAKLTKQGDSEYRRLLHSAAMAAARGDLRPYYQRLIARGKEPTQAHVAVARKLVRIAFSLLKNGTDYDPSRYRMA